MPPANIAGTATYEARERRASPDRPWPLSRVCVYVCVGGGGGLWVWVWVWVYMCVCVCSKIKYKALAHDQIYLLHSH